MIMNEIGTRLIRARRDMIEYSVGTKFEIL